MDKFRDSWWLAIWEIRSKWISLVWSSLFNIYCVFAIISLTNQAQNAEAHEIYRLILAGTVNFFVLIVMQNLGVLQFHRRYFRYWKTDIYTKRLAFFKQMPISNVVLVRSRLIIYLLSLGLMSFVFFIPYYFLMRIDQLFMLTVNEYIAFALFWLGVSAILGSLSIYGEFAGSGKLYLRLLLLSYVIFLIGGLCITYFLETPIWTSSMELIRSYGYIASAVSLGTGVLVLYVSEIRVRKLLEKRSL
ncbi:hypothetical protein [Paenibacillus eucommiae]|uniref:ABC transporter permease n=1 Tax=Paenibacillus eucommiae TaxID=1355755 RepID=A0ABS4IXW6_9BACL|nr:hypothetical protein [Paenibacillus eucommiae]MBP1992438.1 hypothetical protein [Paenibacillus eucommiae]